MAMSYSSAASGSKSTSSGSIIDCNHPYYLSSSDHPGMILVTITLTEHNYSQWCRSMRIALSSKLKLAFIDGSYAKPVSTSHLTVYWNRCNDIVISWILNTVSPEIRQSIMFMNSATEIWSDLATRFAHTNIPKLFNLKRAISSLSQDNMSISTYFTRFRALNDELESLSELPKCSCAKCTCNVNAKLNLYMKSSLLAQFLMGLNESFTVTRGHILMMTPPPSPSEAYGILLQEEHQREKSTSVLPTTEHSSMSVK
ncbi:uncharacterized protein LOC141712440 [Apium graveolens]|uniref:uncharacterized protein LOC141712440 n=1 Tax=Apium graveolens TaxID=4045 RepID=UPI003D796F8B